MLTRKKLTNDALLRNEEIDALVKAKSHVAFQAASPEALNSVAALEALLDNPDYQPTKYLDGCKYFGFDPERPRFPSMKPTFQLESWQVTGIRQMICVLNNPLVNVCTLADATGLGKTIEICGLWIGVSPSLHRYHARL